MTEGSFLRRLWRTVRPAAAHTSDGHQNLQPRERIVPDAKRCVECGICAYNCPVGIPVRDMARVGAPIDDPRCITCGICVEACPRGTLRWETDTHELLVTWLSPAVEAGNDTTETS